ncbi:MAG: hypothetical protein HRF48_02225 [Chloroflexota bacterium]|jgi:hypothetical protein
MTALQFNLFTGQPEDRRTRKQRQADRARELPKQTEMFSQRDIAQFGVKANPHIPLSGNVKLLLIPEDPRTPEEVERDLQRKAERNTRPMFSD